MSQCFHKKRVRKEREMPLRLSNNLSDLDLFNFPLCVPIPCLEVSPTRSLGLIPTNVIGLHSLINVFSLILQVCALFPSSAISPKFHGTCGPFHLWCNEESREGLVEVDKSDQFRRFRPKYPSKCGPHFWHPLTLGVRRFFSWPSAESLSNWRQV